MRPCRTPASRPDEEAAKKSPYHATVEAAANMIVHVCSPLASATNGAALRVGGGVARSIV